VVGLDRPLSYRFRAGGFTSPTGFTQPAGQRRQLTIASADCQHYETGFYAAHRDIAEWRPDLVLFLGDFIYEGPSRPVGGDDDGVPIVRSHDGPEPKDLAGYRARYALYLGDADLQAARAVCPWLVVWDDHEVENNYAGTVAENPDEDADFRSRRAQAYRVWWEHMPTRLPAPIDEQPYPIYRGVDYGELAKISVLDGRQFRSDQACGDIVLSVEPPCPEVAEPDRTMLGAEQEAWLAEQFAAGEDVIWNVLGQQTVLSDTRLDQAILNYDQWDGYPAARERLLAQAPHDLIVITGDIHLAGVGQLGPGPNAGSAGVEFVTTSISSTANVDDSLEELVRSLPGIVDVEIAHRGYIRHTVTGERWVADYRIVDNVSDPASPVSTWKTFVVEHGSNTVTEQV
jgi:alkaline phosphatase D